MSAELVEVETGEVLVRGSGVIDRMSPTEATEWAHWVREVMSAALTEGTDYGVIPGVDKPSLWKSGAELLLLAAGLGSTTRRESVELDGAGGRLGVYYKTTIHRGSRVVAECEGYAGYDESRYYISAADAEAKERANATRYQRPARPDKFAEYRAPWNTLIKIAQKRALVGATLIACAASGLFTQDLEDEREPVPAAPPAVGSPAWVETAGWGRQEALDGARTKVREALKARYDEATGAGLWREYQRPDGDEAPPRPRTVEEHRAWVASFLATAGGALVTEPESAESGPAQAETTEEGSAGSDGAAEPDEGAEGDEEWRAGPVRPTEDVAVGPALAAVGPVAADFPDNDHRGNLDRDYARYGLDGLDGEDGHKAGLIERLAKMPRTAVVAQLKSRGVTLSTEWDEDAERRLLGAIVIRNAAAAKEEEPEPGTEPWPDQD